MNLANLIFTTGTKYDELAQNIVDIEDKQRFFEDLIYKDAIESLDTSTGKLAFPTDSLRHLHVRLAKHKHPEWLSLENIRNGLDSERRAQARNLEKLNNLFKVKTAILKTL